MKYIHEFSGQLGDRARRLVLLLSSIGVGFFASASAYARQDGDRGDLVLALGLALMCAVLCALATTRPPRKTARH